MEKQSICVDEHVQGCMTDSAPDDDTNDFIDPRKTFIGLLWTEGQEGYCHVYADVPEIPRMIPIFYKRENNNRKQQ